MTIALSNSVSITISSQITGVPTWVSNATVNQWVEVPSTALSAAMYASPGGASTGFYAYSAGCLHPTTLNYYALGGGHSDYAGNEVYSLNLNSNTPSWTGLHAPTYPVNGSLYGAGLVTTPPDTSVPGWYYYWDGRPSSTHTWQQMAQVIPSYGTAGQILRVGSGSVWGNGNGEYNAMDAWDIASKDYTWINPNPVSSPNGPNPNFTPYSGPGVYGDCIRDNRGNLWVTTASQGSMYGVVRWVPSTKVWSNAVSVNRNTGAAFLYDSLRDRVVMMPHNGLSTGMYFSAVDGSGSTAFTLTGTTPPAPNGRVYGSGWYEPGLDQYVLLPEASAAGQALNSYFLIDPVTFVCSQVSTTVANGSTQPTIPAGTDAGYWNLGNRFCYVPAFNGFVCMPYTTANMFFLRTH